MQCEAICYKERDITIEEGEDIMENVLKLKLNRPVPIFELPSTLGRNIQSWEYKQRKNVVILFLCSDSDKNRKILQDFADNYDQYLSQNTEILAIITKDQEAINKLQVELALPFPILSDISGTVADKYTQIIDKCPLPSVFVTDKFGILYYQSTLEKEDEFFEQGKILEWLDFIEAQCPECTIPVEWSNENLELVI